jgi:hypothetical protein
LSCGKPAFKKQLTAAGFQLKGTGWYATDFRGGTPPATGTASGPVESPAAPAAADKPAATTAAPATTTPPASGSNT